MKRCAQLLLVFVFVCHAAAQDRPVLTDQFVIARHTFFDFGPPNDYYELFFVRAKGGTTSIERITLTPAGDACAMPAKLEVASGSISEPIVALVGPTSPCAIPEKELRRELKRCKKCLVFSGANVAMQVQCGDQTRVIRADILDKDMFDPAPNTPTHTSWTMQLLGRLDQAVGPGVMDKPIFPITSQEPTDPKVNSEAVRDVEAGKYDALFQGAPDKPSDVFRAARSRPPAPTVVLVSSTPFQPEKFALPQYPPLPRLAHIEGKVVLSVDVDADGIPGPVTFQEAHPMLKPAVEEAVKTWRFPAGTGKRNVVATINFALNCPVKGK